MTKDDLIVRTNQAILTAEAEGFIETAKSLRILLSELKNDNLGCAGSTEEERHLALG